MPGLTSGVLLLGMFAAGKKLGYRDTGEVRRKVERQQTRPKPYGPPKKLDRTCDIALDFRNGWPCYRVSPSGTRPATEVLYLHGGAYIEEIGANHWHLIRQLATDGPAHVTVPLYPLAPRGTARGFVPAATELAASLTERAAGPTVFMGDSAGGGMALALAQRLRDSGRTPPDELVLISPWLDVSMENPGIAELQPGDPMLAVEPLRFAGALWADGLAPGDPMVSPVNGGTAGLPRTTVLIGTRDILLADARRFRDLASATGVTVDFHEERHGIHAYPLWPTVEARRARRQLTGFVRRAASAGVRPVAVRH
ncbi:alpha/beta hydrolase fold domain-containing protein [Streptomyces sp. Ru87]|uniref:alpha/beta hydrolase fold domain-containing protein n=1 Tax=Streptomyces sp. Ru87 TaxID=2044307 RepID=UPI000BF4EA40|nr:alpha/beta hydrolase [Streptomyces sp. Ru87]PGH52060.1 lipase [Streptomyces sp. Ru87]